MEKEIDCVDCGCECEDCNCTTEYCENCGCDLTKE